MATAAYNRHRPRLMRAPHTSPPLPATTTSLLVSGGSTSWNDDDEVRLSPTALEAELPDDQAKADVRAGEHDRLTIDTFNGSTQAVRAGHSIKTSPLAKLPQELILHILAYVHHDLVHPSQPSHPAYFVPLEQRQQAAHLALLRLSTVCPQFAAAILGPQSRALWHHLDGSATFPVPRADTEGGQDTIGAGSERKALLAKRHLSPALVIALARTAGRAVSSLSLNGVHFAAAAEPNGGIGSVFSAAQLFEHILDAQGVRPGAEGREQDGPSYSHASAKVFSFTSKVEGSSPSHRDLMDSSDLQLSSRSAQLPGAPLRTTQLTHLDLRSLRVDPIQLPSARRALATLMTASPNLQSLRLANASPRLVDDALLDNALVSPYKLRELDLSRCAGVSAEGLIRLLRKVTAYQCELVQTSNDEDAAREIGLQVLRIVGLRSHPPSPVEVENMSAAAQRHRQAGRRMGHRAAHIGLLGGDTDTEDEEEDVGDREDDDTASRRMSEESASADAATSATAHPLEDLMSLLGRTSAHSLEVLDASYVLDLTDVHVLALTHMMPRAASRGWSASHRTSTSGPPKLMTIQQEQIKLTRAQAWVKLFNTRRSSLARAVDEQSSLTNAIHRTVFPRLRSLALSSNPRLTGATCGFLVAAMPNCETLELGGWSSRAFLDHERDADGRRVTQRRNARGVVAELPGDGPLVDLLESMPRIRRIDLEGAKEITDAVLRALTPAPSVRGPENAQAQTADEEKNEQPGKHLTHLIVSHAFRLSPRAMLDLMRGATRLVHLELDDTRAGCDHVAKEWAMLMKVRKSGLKAAASALALPFTTPPSEDGAPKALTSRSVEAPTPYLSLVDCRGFSKEEYERLSRKGLVRPREAIGVRPKLANVVPGELDFTSLVSRDDGAEVYEWGRDWFGYEGRAEVVPVSDKNNNSGSTTGDGGQSPNNSSTASQSNVEGGQPSSPASRASRLTLSLPLGLGIALARRASGLASGDESDDGSEEGGGNSSAAQLSLPGFSFRIRAQLGSSSGTGASSQGADKYDPDGDETNPALGVLKSFWGWQTVDVRAKARKKRLAKEEKVRKAAAAAAAAAAASAAAKAGRAQGRPGGSNSRSLSFGGIDAALRNAQDAAGGGTNTGLRNSTAAALALLLRRTGASSAGAAMSAAFGPMSPPVSRSPSPTSSPTSSPVALAGGGIPIPGASQDGGGTIHRYGRTRRSDSNYSVLGSAGYNAGLSPSTPGAHSTMSAFSLMALAGQRGGATSMSSRGSLFFASPSTSPTWERSTPTFYGSSRGGQDAEGAAVSSVTHVTTRQALAFAEAAAAAGLSPTEAEMLAIAATSDHATRSRLQARSLSAASRAGTSALGLATSPGAQLYSSPVPSELSLVRTRSSSGRGLRDKMREKGDRAKGRIRRLFHPGQSGAYQHHAAAGASVTSSGGDRRASASTSALALDTGGRPGSAGAWHASSRPASGTTTPRRPVATAPATPPSELVQVGQSRSAPLPATPSSSRMTAPPYYAPIAPTTRDGRSVAEGLVWDDDNDEVDAQGCMVM